MSECMIQNNSKCGCYDCYTTEDYLKIKNCLSELVTEVQKAKARKNLGISDEYTLKWGNITGYIQSQDDLMKEFQKIKDLIDEKIDSIEIDPIKDPYNHPYVDSDDPNITSVGDALDKILYKDLIITNKVSPNLAELGETLHNVKFSWTYNKPIFSQTFDGIEIDTNLREYILDNISSTTSKVLEVQYNKGNKSKSVTFTITFKSVIYVGVTSNLITTSEDILNYLQPKLTLEKNGSVSVNASPGEYIYLAIPNRIVNPVFNVGGFEGGFTRVVTNLQFSKNGEIYTIYKSDNHSLGETTILIK